MVVILDYTETIDTNDNIETIVVYCGNIIELRINRFVAESPFQVGLWCSFGANTIETIESNDLVDRLHWCL